MNWRVRKLNYFAQYFPVLWISENRAVVTKWGFCCCGTRLVKIAQFAISDKKLRIRGLRPDQKTCSRNQNHKLDRKSKDIVTAVRPQPDRRPDRVKMALWSKNVAERTNHARVLIDLFELSEFNQSTPSNHTFLGSSYYRKGSILWIFKQFSFFVIRL